MAKAHIERRMTGRSYCGLVWELLTNFNPWTSTDETCERCARLKQAEDAKRFDQAVKAMDGLASHKPK